ncbi:hypothetical protein [Geminisphaera colitermitum]|uniref:hypothetical protein n=1 Tax=Geminisphaera colitermitum TaxID=1148786 RepID=UPI000158C609|nr:hypothetical protein [Geminisphaera colitermitum]
MKKSIIITALAIFGAGLAFASSTSEAVALNQAADAVAKSYDAQIAAAKVAQNKEAVATLTAQRKAAILAHNLEHKAEVAALIADHINEISENNPGVASTLIKRHLTLKNTDADGVVASVFAQDADDRALAARLLTLGTGKQAYFYYQYYATAAELADLPGTDSPGVASAVARRAKALGITEQIFPAFYQRSIGKGLVSAGYDRFFNNLVRATWNTNRAAALKLVQDEEAAIATLPADLRTAAAKKRKDDVREIGAHLAEKIKQSN